MRDLVDMWRNTRMVVLTAMSASLYAAILIPFKVLPIIPGVTEFRPANAVPVVCSFLFGPAGAWGAAIGNVIGDFFGGIGPGDMFGFVGNLIYGLVPYKAWEALSDGDPVPRTPAAWAAFLTVVLLASAACALVIGWGINLLGFVPFRVLGNVILFNNSVTSMVLAPLLLSVIYPRVKRGQLRYLDILPERKLKPRAVRRVGLLIVAVATIGGMVMGNLLSNGSLHLPFLTSADLTAGAAAGSTAASATNAVGTGAAVVGFGLMPVIALLLIGVALL